MIWVLGKGPKKQQKVLESMFIYDYCLQPEREKGLKQGVARGQKEERQGAPINLLEHMPP